MRGSHGNAIARYRSEREKKDLFIYLFIYLPHIQMKLETKCIAIVARSHGAYES